LARYRVWRRHIGQLGGAVPKVLEDLLHDFIGVL
jgi:hypothetical protein